MRNTGGHFAQGRHFAGLNKLLFGFEPLGNIAGGYQIHFFSRIFRRRYPDIDVKGLAIFAQMSGLVYDGSRF